jgi:hypothetical protein
MQGTVLSTAVARDSCSLRYRRGYIVPDPEISFMDRRLEAVFIHVTIPFYFIHPQNKE